MSSDLTKLYQTQISLTEWLEKMNHQGSEAFRIEDNEKRERLKVLNKVIGLPFDKPQQFSAEEVANRVPEFQQFLQEHGDELCAFRLIPIDSNLPKLRTRGASIQDSLVWFAQQQVDPAKYRVDIVPHPSGQIWSTIFIVNKHGVFGEIIKGSHNQLTQGFYDEGEPITFAYRQFKEWELSLANLEAEEYLQEVLKLIHIPDKTVQEKLIDSLQATFASDYLCGYFETVASNQFGTWFIDYNRILGTMYAETDFTINTDSAVNGGDVLVGIIGSPGYAKGKVQIIHKDNFEEFEAGSILVCEMTSPDYLPLMQKASAVITDLGGILSHAAIVARELRKPCVVGTKNATRLLREGDLVEVEAVKGIIKITKK